MPIHKKYGESLFTNSRPISFLFFKKSNCFTMDNMVFRTEHSTELAALELVDRVKVEMDNNKTPISIFLDLSKVFDNINHKIL